MSKLIAIFVSGLFAAGVAFAEAPAAAAKPSATVAQSGPAASDCEAKAIGKNGKPLAGAAKSSFVKTCEIESKGGAATGSGCEAKAVSKSGKPLVGAAKSASIKKCEADAKSAK